MRTLFRGLAVGTLAFAWLAVACGALKKKGGEDAGEGEGGATAEVAAEAAAPVPAATALASNEGDVARFPDEKPIANEQATSCWASQAPSAPDSAPFHGAAGSVP